VPTRGISVPKLYVQTLANKLPKNPKQALTVLADEVNKRSAITPSKSRSCSKWWKKIVSKASPKELVDVYNHASTNPFF